MDFSGCVNLTDVGVNWLAEILHDSTSLYEVSFLNIYGINGVIVKKYHVHFFFSILQRGIQSYTKGKDRKTYSK